LIRIFKFRIKPDEFGQFSLIRGHAVEQVTIGVFHCIPGEMNLAARKGLAGKSVRRVKGRQVSLVDLKQIVAQNVGVGIAQVIHALVDKFQGLGLGQARIVRQREHRLPGLDMAILDGNFRNAVNGYYAAARAGEQVGEHWRLAVRDLLVESDGDGDGYRIIRIVLDGRLGLDGQIRDRRSVGIDFKGTAGINFRASITHHVPAG